MRRMLVGFDMDGVILDSDTFSPDGWIVEAFKRTLRDFNIPETDENARALYVNNLRENAGAFCTRFGIPDPSILWRRREENYIVSKLAALDRGDIGPFSDVRALEELSDVYPMGIVSNSPQIVVDRVITHFSLERLFRVWIGRGSGFEDLGVAKPAPHLLERMKEVLERERGYYVGDQPEDTTAARAAGLRPIRIIRDGDGGDITTLFELPGFLARCEKVSVTD